jgi:peptidyl-prolyl cis-trans isomerase C/peptidyl-prolyl cis-trans isomerase D
VKKAREKIEKIQGDLKAGKMSFAEVAQRFSEGVAAPMGGDIDYQTKDKLDPVYYDTAVKLGVGATSGIIRSQFGFHIVKLTAKRAWDEADKPQVKRLVFEERRNQIFEKFMSQLRSKGAVTVKNELIKE